MNEWEQMTDETLVEAYHQYTQQLEDYRRVQQQVKDVIVHRLAERNAMTLRSEQRIVKLKERSPSYALEVLAPLLEQLPTYELVKAYTPPATRVVEDRAKWSGTQLRRIEREYGGDVAAIIARARIPAPDSYLVIEAVKGGTDA